MNLLMKILLSIGVGIITALSFYFFGALSVFIFTLQFNPLYIMEVNAFGAIMRGFVLIGFIAGVSDKMKKVL